MIMAIIGVIIGILAGFAIPAYIPPQFSQYVAVAILAALDSVIGAFVAKVAKRYDFKVFITGFLMNALLASFLTYIGTRLDLDLYLAAVVVFGTRLFQNFAEIRRTLLKLPNKKDTIK